MSKTKNINKIDGGRGMDKIENWFKKKIYDRDLVEHTVICGTVHNCSNSNETRSITTSPIVEILGNKVRTKNSIYELGEECTIPESNVSYFLLRKGAKALHKTGNIGRDCLDAELIVVHEETDFHYIGNFAEGLGFVNVRFNKKDCRKPSEKEFRMCMVGRMEEVKF